MYCCFSHQLVFSATNMARNRPIFRLIPVRPLALVVSVGSSLLGGSLSVSSLSPQQGSDVRHSREISEQDPNREGTARGTGSELASSKSVFIRGELKRPLNKNSESTKYKLRPF